MKYAITIGVGGEFYPDPIYDGTNVRTIEEKIKYLQDYREKNNMPKVVYIAEALTPEREAQHNREWQKWCSLID